jgi:hypothetical protein
MGATGNTKEILAGKMLARRTLQQAMRMPPVEKTGEQEVRDVADRTETKRARIVAGRTTYRI